MNYNPQDQPSDKPIYKSFRLTVSNPFLVESIEKVLRDRGLSERELIHESLISYLQENEEIILEN